MLYVFLLDLLQHFFVVRSPDDSEEALCQSHYCTSSGPSLGVILLQRQLSKGLPCLIPHDLHKPLVLLKRLDFLNFALLCLA